MLRSTVLCSLAFALGACATAPPPAPERAPSPPAAEDILVEPRPTVSDPLAELMFQVLRGELAARQGGLPEALESYMAAMRLNDDPRLAERAARLALYLRRPADADEATARWLELDPASAEAWEAAAVVALRNGDMGAADQALSSMIELSPTHGAGFLRLLETLAAEDPNAGLAVVVGLVREYRDSAEAYYLLTEQALRAERPEVALEASARALELDPGRYEILAARVRAQLELGQGEEAVALLERALSRQPDDYRLRLQYARALLSVERPDNALEQFTVLLEDQPYDSQVLYAAALLALELEEHELARDYLLRLVNSGRRLDEAYYYLGRIAEAEGDAKGALRWYRRAQGLYGDEAKLRIAVVLAQLGQLDAARQQLAAVREHDPEQAVRSYLIEGELLREAGRSQDTFQLYSAALEQLPENPDLLYARALAAVELDRIDQAEADLRTVLEQEPDNAAALNALGYTLVDETERYQEGLALIERAYELAPESPAIIDSMGWAYYKLGDYDTARSYLEQAYQLEPLPEIAAHYALALWRAGDRALAQKVLQQTLQQYPDDPILLRTQREIAR